MATASKSGGGSGGEEPAPAAPAPAPARVRKMTFSHSAGMGDVAAAIAGRDAVDEVMSDYNGDAIATDLMSPMTTVDEESILVIAASGRLDLRRCIAYALWVAQGKPAASIPVTDTHLKQALPRVSHILTIHSLHTLAHMAEMTLSVRSSDTLTAILFGQNDAMVKNLRAADVLYAWCVANDRNRAKASEEKQLVTLAVIATAIHRKVSNGHNWLTRTMADPKSVASRALGVAGALRAEFGVFMKAYGHDLWHHLSNDSLDLLACALVGDTDNIKVRAMPADKEFGGRPVGGLSLSRIVDVGEAATERYPVGTLGKAALMTGLSSLVAMVTSISHKVSTPDAGALIAGIEALRNEVGSKSITKLAVTAIKGTMGSAVALAGGYAMGDTRARVVVPLSPSLAAFCASRPTDRDTGEALCKTVDAMVADPKAAGGAVTAALSALAASLRATNDAKAGTARVLGAVTLSVPATITAIEVAEDPAAAAAKVNHERTMEMIKATK